MYRINFLDNGYHGKNNLWRYILTTVLTVVGAFILTLITIIPILIIIYLIDGGMILDQLDSSLSNPLHMLAVLSIFYILSFLTFYACIRFVHHKKFIYIINTVSNVNWTRILKGACLWFAILGIISMLDFMMDPTSVEVSFNPNTFFILLILSLMVFPVQSSLEELFFRGYLMQGIGLLTKRPILPLMITSIIFGLAHYGNGADTATNMAIIIQTFIFGITLGIITLGENGLETAMGVHIANNIFVTVIISNPDDVFSNLPSLLTAGSASTASIPFFIPPIILLSIIFWNKKGMLKKVFKKQGTIMETNIRTPRMPFITEPNPNNIEYNYSTFSGIETDGMQCPNCYKYNPNEAVYCMRCGAEIKTRTDEIQCSNCYAYNPGDAAYCMKCGTEIGKTEEIQCLNCHTPNPSDSVYCMRCGAEIIKYASSIRKSLAFIIDLIILTVVFVILLILSTILVMIISGSETLNNNLIFNVWIILDLVTFFAYFTLFEKYGQTIGKIVMKIKIVNESGQKPVTYSQSIIRNLLLIVDLIPYTIPGLIGIITGLVSDKKQRIGDIAAKTIVIKKR